MTRAAVLDVLSRDHVRTARAKGLTPGRVLRRHVVRNALIPVTTVLGLQMGTLLGGTVLVEYVFNWPGLSTPLLRAVEARDYPDGGRHRADRLRPVPADQPGDGPALRGARSADRAVLRRLWLPGGAVAADRPAGASPRRCCRCPTRCARMSANRLASWLPGSPLGRDEFGRDVLSRLVWGARASLAVAFASAAVACLVGTTLGLLGGWFRGVAEFLAVRAADVVLCFPPMLLALLVVTLLGPGTATLILVLSILYLPGFVRVTFAEVLSARGPGLRGGGAGARRADAAHPAAHGAAEHRGAGAGAVLAGRRGGRGGGERAVLPRPRRGAADAVLGPDDPWRARDDGTGAAAAALALPGADR